MSIDAQQEHGEKVRRTLMSIDAQQEHGEKVRRTLMSIDSGLTVVRGPVPRRCQGLRGTGPRATGCWRFFVPFGIWRTRTTETRRRTGDARARRRDLPVPMGPRRARIPRRRAETSSVGQDRLILTRTTETCRSTGDALPEPVGALWKRANAP